VDPSELVLSPDGVGDPVQPGRLQLRRFPRFALSP
jgi:hypothetical protein